MWRILFELVLSRESWPWNIMFTSMVPIQTVFSLQGYQRSSSSHANTRQEARFLLDSFFPSVTPTPAYTLPLSSLVPQHLSGSVFPHLHPLPRSPGYHYGLTVLGPQRGLSPNPHASRDHQRLLGCGSDQSLASAVGEPSVAPVSALEMGTHRRAWPFHGGSAGCPHPSAFPSL